MPSTELRSRIEHLGWICAIMCLPVLFLLGCKGTLEPTPEPATITFIYRRDLGDHVKEAMAKFGEQYPHITVNLRAASAEQLAGDFDADDADVRAIFTAIVDSQRLRGNLMALDPFIEADESFDESDWYPAALAAFTLDGKLWAIPYGVTSEVIFYNKDLFDRYDVPYPEVGWTWDDFVRTARALRDPQTGVYGFAHSPNTDGWLQWGYIHQHGGRILDDMRNPTRTTFDDPLNIEAMEWYAGLYHEYGVAPTQEQIRRELGGDVDAAFAEGTVGMTSRDLNSQGGAVVGKGWPARWGMAPPPRSTADTALDICGDLWVHGYAISSQTQHPEAAWQLVAFMSRQMAPRQIPPNRSHAESGEYEQLVGSEAAAVARHVLQNGLSWPTRRFSDITLQAILLLGDTTAKIRSGEMTPQEALDWAQQESGRRIVIVPTSMPSPTPSTGPG
jgi:ABC-type glycerol-3-phosphate transport system substrate-binding protein